MNPAAAIFLQIQYFAQPLERSSKNKPSSHTILTKIKMLYCKNLRRL